MKLTKIFSSLLLVAVVVCFTACEKNNELKKNNKTGNGTISGTMGDVVGCWAQVGNYTEYYEIDADGYITCYTNNSKSWEYQEFVYTGEQYVKKSSMVLEWEKDFTAPYQYSKNKLTVYYFLTPTYELEWHSGSEVSVAGSIGECIRIDPNIYFTKHFNSVKTIEDDWKKDSLDCVKKHSKQFSIGNNHWILFAPGNLQYQPSTSTCRFAAHQWEIITAEYYEYYGIPYPQYDINSYGENWVEVFRNKYISNMPYGYYLPSTTEMRWIVEKRPYAEQLKIDKVSVNGISGRILLPDFSVKRNYDIDNTEFTLSEWKSLESLGAIFLSESYNPDLSRKRWAYSLADGYINDYAGWWYINEYYEETSPMAIRLIKDAEDYEEIEINNTDDDNNDNNATSAMTCVEAITHLNENVTVEGYVAFAYTASSTTTQSAWIADDSQTNVGVLEAYNCNITSQVVKGDKVRVEGKMAKFTKTNGEVIYEINGGKMTKL